VKVNEKTSLNDIIVYSNSYIIPIINLSL